MVSIRILKIVQTSFKSGGAAGGVRLAAVCLSRLTGFVVVDKQEKTCVEKDIYENKAEPIPNVQEGGVNASLSFNVQK